MNVLGEERRTKPRSPADDEAFLASPIHTPEPKLDPLHNIPIETIMQAAHAAAKENGYMSIDAAIPPKFKEAPYESPKPTIYSAIVAAQAQAQAVVKDSNNAYGKYKYAAAEDVIREARKALTDNGLALIPRCHHIDFNRPESPVLVGEYLLVHGPSAGVMSIEGKFSISGKTGDKAEAAARTYLLAYTLRDLLLLPRVGEEEVVDQRPDSNGPKPSQQANAGTRMTQDAPKPGDAAKVATSWLDAAKAKFKAATTEESSEAALAELIAGPSGKGDGIKGTALAQAQKIHLDKYGMTP